MSTTVQQLITSAFRDIGAIGSGDTPSTEESNDALVKLNQFLASWSAQGLPVYQITRSTVALTGAASYSLNGVARPVKIKAASVVSTAVIDVPVPILTAQQWATIQDKAGTAAFAEGLYYEHGYPLAKIHLAPKVTAGTLNLHSEKPIGSGLMEVRETLVLSGAASYTVGVGGSLATERPVRVLAASIAAGSSISRGVRLVTAEEWANYPKRGVGGAFAEVGFYDAGYPNATLYLGPIPANGGSLELFSYMALTAFASLSASIDLPPGYERALRTAFALELYYEYPRESGVAVDALKMAADDAKASIFGLNQAIMGSPAGPPPQPVVVAPPPAAPAQ
ncbi:MAG: hypothetical protein LLG20_18505 [Acidobacteriales bacterium]|nr:hypothetical protein [Terriglobales bacterium]